MLQPPPTSTPFPYTTLFRSQGSRRRAGRSGGPLRQDRAWAPLRGAQLGGSEHPRDLGQASPLAGLLRYPSRMGRLVRLFEGRCGRLLLMDLAPGKMLEALADPVIVLQHHDSELRFLNPGAGPACHRAL